MKYPFVDFSMGDAKKGSFNFKSQPTSIPFHVVCRHFHSKNVLNKAGRILSSSSSSFKWRKIVEKLEIEKQFHRLLILATTRIKSETIKNSVFFCSPNSCTTSNVPDKTLILSEKKKSDVITAIITRIFIEKVIYSFMEETTWLEIQQQTSISHCEIDFVCEYIVVMKEQFSELNRETNRQYP